MTRLLAVSLCLVAIAWALCAASIHLALASMTEPILPLPLHLTVYFAGPAMLLAGCVLILFGRVKRLGTIFVLLACAWLTWLVGIVSFEEAWPLKIGLMIVILLADAAAVVLCRRVTA